MTPRLVHTLWAAACRPGASAFRRALDDVEGTQRRLLRRIVRANARTAYGEAHDFAAIRTMGDYRQRVPLVDYEGLAPFLGRIEAGERGVLTAAPVRLMEPTGGSTAATKLIPYTAPLQHDFQRAIAPWMGDLYRRHPGAKHGAHYWAVSPVAQTERRTPGGIPIGFEDDSAYLGVLGPLARTAFAVPSAVRHIQALDAWRYTTLRFLVARKNLALLSVWSPTFLTLLLDALPSWADRLTHDLRRGTLTPPSPLAPDLDARLTRALTPDGQRATDVGAALAARDPAERHARLWPHLAVVSAWGDAYAERYAQALRAQLPHAAFQPKGLLATEGVVSIPIGEGEGAVLALRAHVFEFMAPDREPRWAHELERGQTYDVVLTTSGGLYRYRLGDLVEVVGFERQTPRLRFVGKKAWISDRVGEKLNERHVRTSLDTVRDGLPLPFVLIAFDPDRQSYTLFVQSDADTERLTVLGQTLDARLRENVHYAYAQDLGQLGPLAVFRVTRHAVSTYHAHRAGACPREGGEGQRIGDLKPAVLDRGDGWAAVFEGGYIP